MKFRESLLFALLGIVEVFEHPSLMLVGLALRHAEPAESFRQFRLRPNELAALAVHFFNFKLDIVHCRR